MRLIAVLQNDCLLPNKKFDSQLRGVNAVSMSHRAFAFDWNAFSMELRPILEEALESDNPTGLIRFVDANLGQCSDPSEGELLSPEWKDHLSHASVQEIGDFALTKYYDVKGDSGLGTAWLELDDQLGVSAREALLGISLSGAGRSFDPGLMGSYFQPPEKVAHSSTILARFA